MKRLSLLGFVGVLASVLSGCPIFDDEGSGYSSGEECRGKGCDTPDPIPGSCSSPKDCGINETCGSDDLCHIGDCTLWGCTNGFDCTLNEDMTTTCQATSGASSSGGQGGASGSGGTGGAGGSGGSGGSPPTPVYCGNPGDCGFGETCGPDGICATGPCSAVGCIFGYACGQDGYCKSSNPAACSENSDCSVGGYRCVSGICTAPADQCSDQTQCPASNKCADGKCTTACAGNLDCPSGYTCDMNLGVCSDAAVPCSLTKDCGGAKSVCVDGACVPRSIGGVCSAGNVWVDNGCIPSQSATFFCAADGQQDSCASGSLCLHHNCYISCEAPNQTACSNLPSFNVCKAVTTASGPHNVCGSNQNLGAECDPTLGSDCGGSKVCIDGFCK